MAAKKVAIIVGSTRPLRVGSKVVDFIHKTFLESKVTPAPELHIVDIASFNLPVLDELAMPAMVPAKAQFNNAHSKAWSAEIAKYDAYVFVSPEYNYGIPGGLKNAIDYLYNEWIGKAVLIVTYGIHGAQLANKNLNETLKGMKLRVVESSPELKFGGEDREDLYKAVGGILGEKTLALWEETRKEELLKAYGDLVTLMEAPVEETSA
jgi:NAD(P)H-dependent FMN reductase